MNIVDEITGGRRMRRNRKADWTRRLVQENRLTVDDLIWPVFVVPGTNVVDPVAAMPGVNRMSVDKLVEAAKEAADLGIPALATFPNIEMHLRDETGSNSLESNNLINEATRAIKKAVPNIGVITDVALDPFTSHGHDGVLRGDVIANDETVELVARAAVIQADAGSDIIAPSFTWKPNEDTSLTLLADYTKDRFGAPRVFLPARGTLLGNPNGKVKHNVFLDEPGLDNGRNQYSLGYLLEHRFNEVWSLNSSARYGHVNLLTNTASGMSLASDLRTLNRSAYRFRIVGDTYSLDNNVQARWNLGSTQMVSLVGLDYRRTREDYYLRAGTASPIDIYRPVPK